MEATATLSVKMAAAAEPRYERPVRIRVAEARLLASGRLEVGKKMLGLRNSWGSTGMNLTALNKDVKD